VTNPLAVIPSPNGMLYILRQSDRVGHSSEFSNQYTWHVSGTKPRHSDGNPFNDVVELYADGPELECVRSRVTGIPDVPSSNCVVWKPPFAQFIYDSLVYEPVKPVVKPPRPNKR